MTATIYIGVAVREQLQAELEQHLVSGRDGRCVGCGEVEPCRRRAEPGEMFWRYGVLPRRRPGYLTSHAHLSGGGFFGWFG